MSPTWKPLQLDHQNSSIPPLLIKNEFGASSYKIWLTDLTYIWTETLDRRQIIQRAFSVDTSIDPSEDASQLRLLLQSIQDALVQRSGTAMNFVRSDDPKQLILQTSTRLPGPLKPLEWRMTLNSAPQSTLTAEFMIPLLSQQSVAKAEKASLLQQLRYKDIVINKLIEKMQSDGVDFSRVFPASITGRLGTDARQTLAKSVKGLAEFDLQEWQSRMIRDYKTLEELRDLISNTFDADPIEAATESQISDSPSYGDWWRHLRRESSQRTPVTSPAPISNTEHNGVEYGEFQTQVTPPKLQAKQGSSKGKSRDPGSNSPDSNRLEHQEGTGSTTDDNDFEVQVSKSTNASAVAQKRPNASPANAFNVARGPQQARADVSGQVVITSGRGKEFVSNPNMSPKGIDTASSSEGEGIEYDNQHLVASEPGLNDKMGNTTAKPKPRIGKIGGKNNPDTKSSKPALATPAKVASPMRTKVNTRPDSDRTNERESIVKASEPARAGRVTVQPRSPSPIRETSQERANRKREQLKRELESKGQAGAKKKRKF